MGSGGEARVTQRLRLPAHGNCKKGNCKKSNYKMITRGFDVAVVSPERVA